MTVKYKVEITYTAGPPSVFYILEDRQLDLEGQGAPLVGAMHVIGDFTRLCEWLKRNGGAKIEITEEST